MEDDFFYQSPNDVDDVDDTNSSDTDLNQNQEDDVEEEMDNDDFDDEVEGEEENDDSSSEYYYDERTLPNSLRSDFNEIICKRGEECYQQGKVLKVFKNGSEYHAKVEGSNGNIVDVLIQVDDDNIASYECSCSYENNCRHEYATLLAIAQGQYQEVDLKESISEKIISVKELIDLIPAEEFKKYILSKFHGDNTKLDHALLMKDFGQYIPEQSYEYYYNNLYNKLVLEEDSIPCLNDDFARIRIRLNSLNYHEVFMILKAIIEAYHDSNKMNIEDDFLNLIFKIGVFMRIIYRKQDANVIKAIDEYITSLKNASFYHNDYLEDMILAIKR